MKYTKWFLVLFIGGLMLSCSTKEANIIGDDEMEEEEGSLFIRFDLDEDYVDYTGSVSFYQNEITGVDSVSSAVSNIGLFNTIEISFNFNNHDSITVQDLLDLKNETFSFNETDDIFAEFRVVNNDYMFGSDRTTALDLSESYLKVDDVVEFTFSETAVNILGSYIISGEFQCPVKGVTDPTDCSSVTNGVFNLSYVLYK